MQVGALVIVAPITDLDALVTRAALCSPLHGIKSRPLLIWILLGTEIEYLSR
jgi:hypothetical protein